MTQQIHVMAWRRIIAAALCALLCALCLPSFAEDESADPVVCFTAVVTRKLTIRKTRDQGGKSVGTVDKDETVEIVQLEKDWAKVLKDGKTGWIVGKYFTDMQVLDETAPVPDMYKFMLLPPFLPRFSGAVHGNVSLRSDMDVNAKLLATLYDGNRVELSQITPDWIMARYRGKLGFVQTEYISDLEVIDPYLAILPDQKLYPYAAVAVNDLDIEAAVPGESGVKQHVPAGSVFPVTEPDEQGTVRIPYLRSIGQVSQNEVELLRVVPYDEAQEGELIGVFSTFFPKEAEREIDEGRRFNIELGVQLVGGTVVQPGEQFSFNKLAAPYAKSKGYELGPIINYTSDKKTGYGGGVCQVSTTLYNVVLQLPLKVVRWRPHSSYGISYAPVNFDCAVGDNNLDFIFANELPYAIRIQLDVWDGVVCARIYRDGELAMPDPTETPEPTEQPEQPEPTQQAQDAEPVSTPEPQGDSEDDSFFGEPTAAPTPTPTEEAVQG